MRKQSDLNLAIAQVSNVWVELSGKDFSEIPENLREIILKFDNAIDDLNRMAERFSEENKATKEIAVETIEALCECLSKDASKQIKDCVLESAGQRLKELY